MKNIVSPGVPGSGLRSNALMEVLYEFDLSRNAARLPALLSCGLLPGYACSYRIATFLAEKLISATLTTARAPFSNGKARLFLPDIVGATGESQLWHRSGKRTGLRRTWREEYHITGDLTLLRCTALWWEQSKQPGMGRTKSPLVYESKLSRIGSRAWSSVGWASWHPFRPGT